MNTETEKKEITEADLVQVDWYKEAKNQTLESLPDFLNHLANDYVHDHGTGCHAVAAAALGAAWAMNQAGCIMWEFIKKWMYPDNKCGMRIIDYDKMLYPQYGEQFTQKTLEKEQWDIMREEAAKLIEVNRNSKTVSPEVLNHWISIRNGKAPFGYTII
jgi:hypothetical protein